MTSAHAITTLVVSVTSAFFVIHPISIPTIPHMPRIPINLTTAPVFAVAFLWVTRCLDLTVIHDGIIGTEGIKPYNIVILFLSLAYMAITLDITGILRAVTFWILRKCGSNTWKIYLCVYLTLTLLSIVLGNDLITHFGTACLVHYTAVVGLDPIPWITAVFAAANTASMVLFIGNPTNVVICEGLGVNNAAFTAYTILPFLTCNLVCFAVLALQYRSRIPLELTCAAAHQDPRSALLDPVGAWVGSFMLGTTLVLSLVVHFFGIDFWMVSLPFAVGKLMFDLAWDYYRYSHGISMLGRNSPKAVRKECDQSHTLKLAPRVKASSADTEQSSSFPFDEETAIDPLPSPASPPIFTLGTESQHLTTGRVPRIAPWFQSYMDHLHDRLDQRFPTFVNALPRLPFAVIPFAFSQFILIEALNHQGWIDLFASQLIRTCVNEVHPTIWLIGVLGVVLCNLSGANIGATILLTKIVRTAALSYEVNRGAAIALAVASNIGAMSFAFSASRSGLLWRTILKEEGVHLGHRDFALQNLVPLLAMTTVGLGIISAEMAILF